MDFNTVWESLRDFGTAQNRKVYARHGVRSEQFGVSFAKLKELAKKIRVDQDLADRLWATGNHDARVLATMIGDASKATASQLRQWANDLDNYVVADAFAKFVSRTNHSRQLMEQWMKSRQEFVGQAGWNVLAVLAMARERVDIDFTKPLQTIEQNIHRAQNRTRHAMNGALIAIALRSRELEKMALAAAERIGPVEVDHGDTSCETRDVATYVAKAKATLRKMAARRKTKTKSAPAKAVVSKSVTKPGHTKKRAAKKTAKKPAKKAAKTGVEKKTKNAPTAAARRKITGKKVAKTAPSNRAAATKSTATRTKRARTSTSAAKKK